MSIAFEITEDDVALVVTDRIGRMVDQNEIERLYENLDHAEIEKAALAGDAMEDQTEYAYEEMERQIRPMLVPVSAPAPTT